MMNSFTLKRALSILFMKALFISASFSCDLADLTLTNVVDNNDGTFTIDMEFCTGGGQNATHSGADQNTGAFAFMLYGGATFANYPGILESPQTQAQYTGQLWNVDTLLYTHPTEWWACLGGCGPVQAVCKSISITTIGLPSSIFLLGMEGGGNPAASCQGPDMYVYPPTFGNDPCDTFTLIADAGPDQTVQLGYGPNECVDLTVTTSGQGSAPFSYSWSNGASSSTITVCPSQQTTYTVTITDDNGCSTTDDVTVDVEDVRCGRRNNKVLMCRPNGSTRCISVGQVSSKLNKGWTVGSCNTSNSANNRASNKSIFTLKEVNIYPTVFENQINIDLQGQNNSYLEVFVHDLQGRILISESEQILQNEYSKTISLNVAQLESGYYIMSIINQNGILKTQKVIKL